MVSNILAQNSLGLPSVADQGKADEKSQQENRARNCDGNCAGVSQTLNIEEKLLMLPSVKVPK